MKMREYMKLKAPQGGGVIRFSYLFVMAGLLLVATAGWRTVATGDIWMHLTVGRQIAAEGVPRIETLSLMRPGEFVVAPNWLYDLFMYRVYIFGGVGLVTFVHVVAVLLALCLLLPLARQWAHLTTISLSLILATWLLLFRFTVGPHVFVLFIPSLFLFLLYRDRKASLLWVALPLLQWLWTNIHPSFLLGPLLCVVAAIQGHYFGSPRLRRSWMRRGLAMAGACLVVTALNPYRFQIYKEALHQWSQSGSGYTQEWISPFAGLFQFPAPSRLITLALLIFATGLITFRKRLPVLETVAASGAAFVVVRSSIQMEWIAVLGFPFMALSLQSTFDTIRDIARMEGPRWRLRGAVLAGGCTVLLLAFSFVQILSNRVYGAMGSASRFGVGETLELFPSDAGRLIEQPGFPERALNLPFQGGYLAWRFPERRLYSDPRSSLYEATFHEQLHRALMGDDDAWKRMVDEPRINAIILPGYDRRILQIVPHLLRRDWDIAYMDGSTVIFLRESAVPAHLLRNPTLWQAGMHHMEESRQAYHLELQAHRYPAASPRLIGSAYLLLATGRPHEAVNISDMLLNGNPNMVSGWLLSTLGYLQLGQWDLAEERLEQACRLKPGNKAERAWVQNRAAWAWLFLSRVYASQDQPGDARRAFLQGQRLDAQMADEFGDPLTAGDAMPDEE